MTRRGSKLAGVGSVKITTPARGDTPPFGRGPTAFEPADRANISVRAERGQSKFKLFDCAMAKVAEFCENAMCFHCFNIVLPHHYVY